MRAMRKMGAQKRFVDSFIAQCYMAIDMSPWLAGVVVWSAQNQHCRSRSLRPPPAQVSWLLVLFPRLVEAEFVLFHAGQVQLHQLVAALKDEGQEDKQELRRRLRRVQAPGKLLQAPLPRHVVERMEREVAYMGNRKELAQWESVVEQNRVVSDRNGRLRGGGCVLSGA